MGYSQWRKGWWIGRQNAIAGDLRGTDGDERFAPCALLSVIVIDDEVIAGVGEERCKFIGGTTH